MKPPEQIRADQVGRNAMILTTGFLFVQIWFGIVAIIVSPDPNPKAFAVEYFALFFAGVMLIAWAYAPRAIANKRISEVMASQPVSLRDSLAPVYVTRTLYSGAILSAASLNNLITYIVTGKLSNIGMAGFCCFIMAAGMPMQSRFESWVETIRRDHI